jgi:hypothetical protein
MALPEEVEKALALYFSAGDTAGRVGKKISSQAARIADDQEALEEFEDQHGTPYDPKSRMDRGKMGSIIADRKKPQKKKTSAEMAEEIPDLGPDVGGLGLPPIKTGRETDPEKLKDRDEIAKMRAAEEKGLFDDGAGVDELAAPGEDFGREVSQATLEELFKTTHGGPFDPKSSMDKKKMEQIKELLSSGEDFGDLSDRKMRNRFALKIYRNYDYV